MTSKQILRKRLGVAIGQSVTQTQFTRFFACFCERQGCPQLRTAKELDYDEVTAFSQYCGYDLHFPIPLPLW